MLCLQGSDIETLGSETAVEYGAELLERPPVEEPQVQDVQTSVSAGKAPSFFFFYPDVNLIDGVCLTQHTFMFTLSAVCAEERTADSLDNTLGEQTLDETLNASEVRGHENVPGIINPESHPCFSLYNSSSSYRLQAGDEAAGKEPVLSSSDLSDIVTLPDLKEGEHAEVEEEAAASEDLYLGTSCSSQYTFSAAETGRTAHTLKTTDFITNIKTTTQRFLLFAKAGLLLSQWKLPQTLMNLSSRLRSQLTGGRSFPGGLIWKCSDSDLMLSLLSSARN